MLPPTYCTCLEVCRASPPRRPCSRCRRPRPRRRRAGDGPRRATARLSRAARPAGRAGRAGRAAMTGWPAAASSAPRAELRARARTRASMTLDGTNTWVLREPDVGASVVVDPGPLDEGHLDAVRRGRRRRRASVLLTHGHLDHTEAARAFAERVGCGVRALDPAYRLGGEGLHDGDVVDVDGLEIRVVGTPGPHRRLAVVRAARTRRGAHRRHRARPRYDGRGPPRRPARRLPRLAAPAARPGRGARSTGLAGPRPGARRRARRCSTTTSPTASERLDQVRARSHAGGASTRGIAADECPRVVEHRLRRRRPGRCGARRELSASRAQLDYLDGDARRLNRWQRVSGRGATAARRP